MQETTTFLRVIKHYLAYDSDSGVFKWRLDRSYRVKAGSVAGTISGGYVFIGFNGKTYAAHRLAWLMSHGAWPRGHIDHINRVKTDNRILNLREATPSQNMQNTGLRRDNSSGAKGVSLYSPTRKWMAKITIHGKQVFLGYYARKEDAARAYELASVNCQSHRNNYHAA